MRLETKNGSLLTSVAWERYVPTVKHIHCYGCRIALLRNQPKQEKGHKTRSVYCGAYQLKADAVRALASAEQLDEILSAEVVHKIESGEIAHTELIIFLKPDVFNIEGTKTAIIDRLWNVCSGPLSHKCDYDLDIAPHPSLSLSTPPAGAYSDTRSYLCRLWYIIRFQVHFWFWRANMLRMRK